MLQVAIGACAVAFLVFAGEAINEWSYAGSHPYAYGPAKVIAWIALAGALVAAAAGAVAYVLLAERRSN